MKKVALLFIILLSMGMFWNCNNDHDQLEGDFEYNNMDKQEKELPLYYDCDYDRDLLNGKKISFEEFFNQLPEIEEELISTINAIEIEFTYDFKKDLIIVEKVKNRCWSPFRNKEYICAMNKENYCSENEDIYTVLPYYEFHEILNHDIMPIVKRIETCTNAEECESLIKQSMLNSFGPKLCSHNMSYFFAGNHFNISEHPFYALRPL